MLLEQKKYYNVIQKEGVVARAIISLRLNQEEETFFKNYAKFTGKSLSELFKHALAEEIENELDYKLGVEGFQAFEEDGRQGYSVAAVREMLGLDNG